MHRCDEVRRTFEQSIEIAASAQVLFSLSQDYSRRLEWDPFLREARLLGAATETAVGAHALCVAKSGMAMEFVHIAHRPPDVAAVEMVCGPWFIRTFAGSWRFQPLTDGGTKVTFRYHVATRPHWLTWLLTPWVSHAFEVHTRRRLEGLKCAVEKRCTT